MLPVGSWNASLHCTAIDGSWELHMQQVMLDTQELARRGYRCVKSITVQDCHVQWQLLIRY